MKNFLIETSKICNLSRVPTKIEANPLKITVDFLIREDVKSAVTYLSDYYNNLSYETANDLFGTNMRSLEGYKHTNCFLPWYHTSPILQFEDNAFITKINEKHVFEKVLKLQTLLLSIKSRGYVPENFLDRKGGNITGYFLEGNGCQKFYVVSGNHRVAVLSALGEKNIKVALESTQNFKNREFVNMGWSAIPKVIKDTEVDRWPAVKSGFMKSHDALTILEKFVKFN